MKRYLIYFVLLFSAFNVFAGGGKKDYWYCNQVGTDNKEALFAHSGVFFSSKKIKAKEFEGNVAKQVELFKESFPAKCLNFHASGEAEESLGKRIEFAERHKAKILLIKFP